MPEELNLSNLQPAQPRKERKRVGRGLGSGKGRYSGRGIKGQKSRAGSHRMRAGFEGGQMPLAMRLPKLRGNTSRDAMPVGPFRTYTQPVNIRDLDRFEAGEEVTPETLKAKGLIRSIRKDVKLLGVGELTKKLSITVHGASATAREKVEAAGGTLTLLKEPKVKKASKRRTAPVSAPDRRRDNVTRGDRRGRGRAPEAGRWTSSLLARSVEGMFSWLANAWRVPELRRRVLFTAFILAVYRLGSWIPAPGVNASAIAGLFGSGVFSLLSLFSGGALARFSIFALGIMPYVTASIVIQLLTVAVPQLEQLKHEGEAGQAKITQYTRYGTVGLAAAQSAGYAYLFHRSGGLKLDTGRLDPDRDHPDRRLRAADVDGRADHQARDRQRHLDPDLRLDPHLRPRRHQRVGARVAGREALLPDRRARRRRLGRLRPGGPAPDPDPVREADGRAAARWAASRPTCRCA